MTPVPDNRRGILAMLAAMLMFVSSDTLVKLVSAEFPPAQVMAVRGVFAACFALALVLLAGDGPRLRRAFAPRVLGRSAIEATICFLFFTSLAELPIATITTIGQAAPIILTLMAVALGIERVGWRRWSAILVGFAGVLLVARPSPSGFNVYALIALASAALVAARDLVTRFIPVTVPSTVVTFSTTSMVALGGFVLGLAEDWQSVTRPETLYLVVSAILVTFGSLFIVVAFRGTDVAVVGPFRYSVIVVALVIGYGVFGEWPDGLAVAGTALIVASGVYTLHREQARRREAAGQTPVALEPAEAA